MERKSSWEDYSKQSLGDEEKTKQEPNAFLPVETGSDFTHDTITQHVAFSTSFTKIIVFTQTGKKDVYICFQFSIGNHYNYYGRNPLEEME